LPAIAQLILIDVFAHVHEEDKAYFRGAREKRLGTTLKKFCANRDETVVQFRKTRRAYPTVLPAPWPASHSP
jgi:hypothetical protein